MQSLIIWGARGLTVASLLAAASASAQQPLGEFLASAEAGGALDVRDADLGAAQAGAQVDEARARLLPSLRATAGYTRNQVEVVAQFPEMDPATGATQLERAVITPLDELSASVSLTVPLLDVGAWSTFFASEATSDAASHRADAARADARTAVITAYFTLVAARAVRDSAEQSRSAAEENLAVVESRAVAGLASELDRQRAIADLERARQALAEAELQDALASRSLFVASGLEPSAARAELADDLHEEAGLATWMRAARDQPVVRAAAFEVSAAERARDASWQAFLPTLSGTATERITNASGFGPAALWSVGVSATWLLDFGRPASLDVRDHDVARAEVRLERATRDAETAIHDAWHRVRSLLVRARAARAAEGASERGAVVARARFEAGTGTQLELSQAERDRFTASVDRIRADADLRVARLALRVRSGLAPTLDGGPR